MDINTFIEESIIIHGGRYDYTNTDYYSDLDDVIDIEFNDMLKSII